MTRINLVKVEDLADQHLFAEWREIKMVPAALRRSMRTKLESDILKSIPKKYTLNSGHVLFFYNKMKFLEERYHALTYELQDNRGYNVQQHEAWEIFYEGIPMEFRLDWEPTVDEIKVSVERIVLRLNERPDWYRYYGKVVSPKYFEGLYELFTNE
jgi:deoxyribonuclease (pyrimidine dimer)